jgi:hypothetical protein
LLLGKALDSSGVIAALEDHLVELHDTTTLHRDPPWQLACSDARGTTPVAQERLPSRNSKPTGSRRPG